jgi:spore coat protein SA
MAAGLPIITTNRGGNAEVIETGVNGFVIDGYNRPEALAEKIIYFLEHEDISFDIGKNARKMAEEKYSWERVANELMALFDSV